MRYESSGKHLLSTHPAPGTAHVTRHGNFASTRGHPAIISILQGRAPGLREVKISEPTITQLGRGGPSPVAQAQVPSKLSSLYHTASTSPRPR